MGSMYGGFLTKVLAITASASTTEAIDIRGYAIGNIHNNESSAVVVSYYSKPTKDATPGVLNDSDGNPQTQTIPANESIDLKPAAAGVAYLVLVVSSSTASLTVHVER